MIIIMISRVLRIILTRAETSLACFTPPPLKWWPSLLPLLSATVPSEVRIIDSSPLLPRSHIPSMTCLTVVQTVSPPHLHSPWTHSHLFCQFPFIYVVIHTECLLLWGSVSLRMSINVHLFCPGTEIWLFQFHLSCSRGIDPPWWSISLSHHFMCSTCENCSLLGVCIHALTSSLPVLRLCGCHSNILTHSHNRHWHFLRRLRAWLYQDKAHWIGCGLSWNGPLVPPQRMISFVWRFSKISSHLSVSLSCRWWEASADDPRRQPLQDLHGCYDRLRSPGVRSHGHLHQVRQEDERVPDLQAVRREGRARLQVLMPTPPHLPASDQLQLRLRLYLKSAMQLTTLEIPKRLILWMFHVCIT